MMAAIDSSSISALLSLPVPPPRWRTNVGVELGLLLVKVTWGENGSSSTYLVDLLEDDVDMLLLPPVVFVSLLDLADDAAPLDFFSVESIES
jgi:hypothetical protein